MTWQFCDGDLFGVMSSRDPLKRRIRDLQRLGKKRSRLESPAKWSSTKNLSCHFLLFGFLFRVTKLYHPLIKRVFTGGSICFG